eukprot:TRINITY_DN77_c0_g2_i1.p1 TRINITY_DN77_c0_g2~~TRINITY_DN77_c0_g2_i1.p1  ORF type:complete len:277 (+),score=46.83 TRINITY_DN77_c0_g2_i1:155-985(+)
MGKGPGLFSDIGKGARDLLYKDYNFDHKIALTTYTSTGLEFSSTGIKKGDIFLGDIKTQLKSSRVTTDLKVDTGSNILTTVTSDELAPGLKSILNFTFPDQKSGKVEVQYKHDYAGISSSIGLTATPVANFSGVFGNDNFALGGEVEFDTASGGLLKCNAGLSYSKPDFVSSFTVTNKGDVLKASYLHTVSPLTKTAVGAEIQHSCSKSENTFTIGTQHALDPLTTVKARLDNYGKAAALVQHEWRPKSFITISGEVDSKALHDSAKVGLSIALKP